MKFNSPYWFEWEKIQLLQRWILVHSFLYYNMNESIVDDEAFDNNCKQLVEMQEANESEFDKTKYRYVFEDFDGSTGFHLTSRLNKSDMGTISRDALMLLNMVKNGNK